MADVRAGLAGPVPPHLRDAHYPGAKRLGHGKGYLYPHDEPRGVAAQQYPPDELADRDTTRRPTTARARAAAPPRPPAPCSAAAPPTDRAAPTAAPSSAIMHFPAIMHFAATRTIAAKCVISAEVGGGGAGP